MDNVNYVGIVSIYKTNQHHYGNINIVATLPWVLLHKSK